jgi:hypothetical protein
MFWHTLDEHVDVSDAPVGHTPSEPDKPRIGAAELTESPGYNEFSADRKGPQEAFIRRGVSGVAHRPRTGLPVSIQVKGSGVVPYDCIRDGVATVGREASREAAGQGTSFGMSWSEAIEPTIRPGMALGRQRFIGYKTSVQSGAAQDMQASGTPDNPWLAGIQRLSLERAASAARRGVVGLGMPR